MEELSREEIIELYDQEYQKMMGEWAEEIEKNKIKRRALKEGIEQGITQQTLDIAQKLLKENISLSIISKTTGITSKELKKLMQQN